MVHARTLSVETIICEISAKNAGLLLLSQYFEKMVVTDKIW